MQAQYRNLESSSSASSSSSSSLWPTVGLDSNAAASNLIAASAGGVNWPPLAWPNTMLPTASYTSPNSIIMQQLETQNEVLRKLLEAKEKTIVGVRKRKSKKHKRNDRKRKKRSSSEKDSSSSESSDTISLLESSDHGWGSSSSSDG
jgi:hypothetical protein